MSGSRLIGLGGPRGAGKDAFANALRPLGYRVIGMSDSLFEMLLKLDPLVDHKATGETIRLSNLRSIYSDYSSIKAASNELGRLLQVMGTEIMRNTVSEDFWVNKVREKIEESFSLGESVVVTGLRFPNELKMVEDLGGKTIYIKRKNGLRETGDGFHSSEHSLSEKDFSRIILNDYTLESLQSQARFIGERLWKK